MKLMAWAMIGCAVGLAACQSNSTKPNQPQFLTQKIYHAPAQSYDFDLGSPALRGELKLKNTCSVTGSSLDIKDQIGQQLRIDTLNLNHHPQFSATAESTLKDIVPSILQAYESQYNAKATAPKAYKASANDIAITRLSNSEQNVDLLILKQYDYAYVLQLTSPLLQNDPEKAKQHLQTLVKSLMIPGKKLKESANSLPISFDLSNTDSNARRNWQKTYCS